MTRAWTVLPFAAAAAACASGSGPPVPAPDAGARLEAHAAACSARPVPPFTFGSSFWLNLHNVLFREGKRLRGVRNERPSARPVVSLDGLRVREPTPDEAAVWREAAEFYARAVVDGPHPDSVVIRVADRLADVVEPGDLERVALDPEHRRVLAAAAPVYRAVWWPEHDAYNRRWIARAGALVAGAPCVLAGLADALDVPWPAGPIRVEATVYASWFGAYTTLLRPMVTVASNTEGADGLSGLETLVHEGGHVLLPALEARLAAVAAAEGVEIPRGLPHLLLFHTAGWLVRDAAPGHLPNADRLGIWENGRRTRGFRSALDETWTPRLEGRAALDDALVALLRATERRGLGSR